MSDTHDLSDAPSKQALDRLQAEIAHIVDIYRTVYPTRTLEFTFYEGQDPIHGRPSVHEGSPIYTPIHLGPEFLGRLVVEGTDKADTVMSIFVSIPRDPTPNEMKQQDPDWQPFRGLGMLYAKAPSVYEDIRYRAEMRRKKLSTQRHSFRSLPLIMRTRLLSRPQ